jgi:hypothetical protein
MPPKAYAGQENFRLIIKTGLDLATNPSTDTKILYRLFRIGKKDPLQVWEAAVLAGGESTGKIYHDFSVGHPVPAAGTYELRAHLTIDGKNVPTSLEKWVVGE